MRQGGGGRRFSEEYARNLFRYDESIFSVPRENLLREFLKIAGVACFYLLNDCREVIGFGMCRPCTGGYKIGPLYANDVNTAQRLFADLLNEIPMRHTVIIDSLELNRLFSDFAQYCGLQRVPEGDTTLMFRGAEPQEFRGQVTKRFAELSLEVG